SRGNARNRRFANRIHVNGAAGRAHAARTGNRIQGETFAVDEPGPQEWFYLRRTPSGRSQAVHQWKSAGGFRFRRTAAELSDLAVPGANGNPPKNSWLLPGFPHGRRGSRTRCRAPENIPRLCLGAHANLSGHRKTVFSSTIGLRGAQIRNRRRKILSPSRLSVCS